MQTFYDAIYLAPHLDDVALSCGGQVHLHTSAGRAVLVATFMAGDVPHTAVSEFARTLHDRWALDHNVVAQRRREDHAACAVLGADAWHGSVPDCIYRTDPHTGAPLYPDWEAVIGNVAAGDEALISKLAQQMGHLPPCEQVYAPLGVGRHVDHQITRRAAERCFGLRLRYYTDYPYARDEGAVEAVVEAGADAWQVETIALTETAVAVKIEAIAQYASQISSFFNGREDLAAQIRTYTQQVGGEQVWRRQPAAVREWEAAKAPPTDNRQP